MATDSGLYNEDDAFYVIPLLLHNGNRNVIVKRRIVGKLIDLGIQTLSVGDSCHYSQEL